MLKDCKYFESTGNFCSRVTAMRCDEFPECEFKYIAELKAENDRLKEKIIKLSEEKGHLIVENNTLKEENFNFEEIVKLCKCERYQQTLQEIKAVADASSPFIDNLEIKSATEVGYDYAVICNELEKRLHKVLELITKAESEGV